MGCKSSAPKNPEESAKNRDIEKQLQEDRKRLQKEVKLLLLGAGESGKSTIAKQMKILHLDGFTEEECRSYKEIIYSNVVGNMKTLINACNDLGIPLTEEAKRWAEALNTSEFVFGTLTSEVANAIRNLWRDSSIQTAFARSNEFQLSDSAQYYFEAIDRLAEPNYSPTEQDVLRSRVKTTGIIETEFDVDGLHFRMVDVGGQRSERKKWMHCFQDVTALIFCVAMSEYDLKLYEDESTNRMHESLKLFREICNNRWFTDSAMILFLNKKDIFEQKIKKIDLAICFPEYTGGNDYDKACEYIKSQFMKQNTTPEKDVFIHVTCATDTSNIQFVFNAVKTTILKTVLKRTGVNF